MADAQAGYMTRSVDHFTESCVNPATRPQDALTHETVDHAISLLVLYMSVGVAPLMWKRDVVEAFRKVPIKHDATDLSVMSGSIFFCLLNIMTFSTFSRSHFFLLKKAKCHEKEGKKVSSGIFPVTYYCIGDPPEDPKKTCKSGTWNRKILEIGSSSCRCSTTSIGQEKETMTLGRCTRRGSRKDIGGSSVLERK